MRYDTTTETQYLVLSGLVESWLCVSKCDGLIPTRHAAVTDRDQVYWCAFLLGYFENIMFWYLNTKILATFIQQMNGTVYSDDLQPDSGLLEVLDSWRDRSTANDNATPLWRWFVSIHLCTEVWMHGIPQYQCFAQWVQCARRLSLFSYAAESDVRSVCSIVCHGYILRSGRGDHTRWTRSSRTLCSEISRSYSSTTKSTYILLILWKGRSK